MKRRLFNAGAVVSLVLCFAAIYLWVRSQWLGEMMVHSESMSVVGSNRGMIWFWCGPGDLSIRDWQWETKLARDKADHRRWGLIINDWSDFSIVLGRFRVQSQSGSWHGALPHWALVLVMLIAPGIWIVRAFRRPLTGLCPACGYDLRGTPGSKTCPECGAASAGRREAKA